MVATDESEKQVEVNAVRDFAGRVVVYGHIGGPSVGSYPDDPGLSGTHVALIAPTVHGSF